MPLNVGTRGDDHGEMAHTGKLGWEPPPVRQDDRDADLSRWSPKDNRAGRREDGNRNRWDSGEKQKDWRQDGKGSNNTRDWQRDNGWGSRRRATVDDAARGAAPDTSQASSSHPSGRAEPSERAWEPAAGWRQNNAGGNSNSNNRSDQQGGQRKQNRHKNKKKNRNKNNNANNTNTTHANANNANNTNNTNANDNGVTHGNATGSNAVNSKQDRSWRVEDTQLNKLVA